MQERGKSQEAFIAGLGGKGDVRQEYGSFYMMLAQIDFQSS